MNKHTFNGPHEFTSDKTAQTQQISFKGFCSLWEENGVWRGRDNALDPDAKGITCAIFTTIIKRTDDLLYADIVITDFEKYWLVNDFDVDRIELSIVDSKLFRRVARRTLE